MKVEIMVTIKDTSFSSSYSLASVLNVKTKAEMLKIADKLHLYVSPNLKKDETARRLATEILENPEEILCSLNKQELEILDEFVKAGPNTYVTRKIRKTEYKLQKFCLVLTNIDDTNGEWHMLMLDCVRKTLAPIYGSFLEIAQKGIKLPSAKELRIRSAMDRFLGGE